MNKRKLNMELKGKVAVITGSSGGIGEAIARDLDQAGAKIVLTGRSEEKLKRIAVDLQQAAIVTGEITAPALPAKLMDAALTHFGQLDIFINNAGVMKIGSIDEVDIEGLCEMVRINLESVVRCSYHVMRHFKQQNSGYLINMSSIAGTRSFPTIGVYNATKFAVEALSDALRMEVAGSGIGVAVVEPGTVETGLYDTWSSDARKVVGEGIMPSDIARAVRFILEQPDRVRVPRVFMVPYNQQAG